MQSYQYYRWVQLFLAIVLTAGLLAWFFLRQPEGTSEGAIFTDVALTGRVQQVVLDTVRAVRQTATLPPGAATDQIHQVRAQVGSAIASAERLEADLEVATSRWIPVSEASILLEGCRSLGASALKLAPTGDAPQVQAPDDSLEDYPDIDGITPEASQILEAGATQLVEQAARLAGRVQQAIVSATYAQETLLGFGARDYLLATTILGSVIGIAMLSQACRRLRIPPERIEQMELDLIGRVDRRAAMRKCHDRVRSLMEMAEQFARGQTD